MALANTPRYLCQVVDYNDENQSSALLQQLQAYAQDPMGGGARIPSEVSEHLIARLAARPFMFSILLLDTNVIGDVREQAVGFANCIESFSTFKGQAVINIHDFAVSPNHRGKGLADILLASIDEQARTRGACKVTLEVLEGNTAAQQAYTKAGFIAYELDPSMGRALFWEKPL